MNIFVDESGTFPSTFAKNSWSVIAAYVCPEGDRKRLENLVMSLRRCSAATGLEVKLGQLGEPQYFAFLRRLAGMNGIAFATATDMSMNPKAAVTEHRDAQAEKVVEHREKMVHMSMRNALTELSETIRALPLNLYVQLVFQARLFHEVVTRASLYYVQRWPQTLREIRWRVDQKDVIRTGYEKTFRQVLPALLQSASMKKPFLLLEGADYSYMSQYEFPDGKAPRYLSEVYGLPVFDGFNVGKMVGGNFQFCDSKKVSGIQVADLLASGFRRLLKGEFSDNDPAARLLGQMIVQSEKGTFPLNLVTIGPEQRPPPALAKRLKLLRRHVRPMLR